MYKSSMYNNYINEEGKIYCYNSYSKARVRIDDRSAIDTLVEIANSSESMSEEQSSNFDMLRKNGFVISAEYDESAMLKYKFVKNYFASDKLGLILLPTMKCNFACPYCFERPSVKEISSENPNFFNAVNQFILKNSKSYNHVHLNFFGGEPLLMKDGIIDFSKSFINNMDNAGIPYNSSIVTNGSLIDTEVLDTLNSLNCRLLQITLDGSEEQHNRTRKFANGLPSFELLISKIQEIAAYINDKEGFRLLVRFNLNSTLLSDVQSTLERIDASCRHNIQLLFRPVFNTQQYTVKNKNSYDELDEFNKLGKSLGYVIYKNKRLFSSCEACGDMNFFHVLPDLSIWKCINDLTYTDAKIGQLHEDGSVEWYANKIHKWFGYADFLSDEKCRKCSYAPDCLGGCIRNYAISGKRVCSSFNALSSAFKY